jgi:hypothetical protein
MVSNSQFLTSKRKMSELERGLGSVGKLKILRVLITDPRHAFTRYEIGKKVPNDPVSIRNDLNALIQVDWVKRYKIQHLDKYAVNMNNDVIKHLTTFFQSVKYIRR